jgi:glutathione S-transferase
MQDLRVFHLPGGWGLQSVSPFCLKLDSFLQITGIAHQACTASTPFPGPKKKAPWIEYGSRAMGNSKMGDHKMGDSGLIIQFLMNEFDADPDKHLDSAQRGHSTAIQRLIEEHLYWAMVYDRWQRDDNWPVLKNSVLGDIPAPIRSILAPLARRSVTKQLAGHGMGLHHEDEIAAFAQADIAALAAMVGPGPFTFGDQVSMADAVIYSLLANIRYTGFASPMKAMIDAHPGLVSLLENFQARVYPESTAGPI